MLETSDFGVWLTNDLSSSLMRWHMISIVQMDGIVFSNIIDVHRLNEPTYKLSLREMQREKMHEESQKDRKQSQHRSSRIVMVAKFMI